MRESSSNSITYMYVIARTDQICKKYSQINTKITEPSFLKIY